MVRKITSSRVWSDRISTNSSPPRRATVSPSRTAACSRSPTWRSTSSPKLWPRLSLMTLKWSRSMNTTAIERVALREHRLLQAVVEEVAVGQPGERVVVGLALELLLVALALDRVLHRLQQQLAVDLALDEVVLRAALHRVERELLVVVAGEHDDRHLRASARRPWRRSPARGCRAATGRGAPARSSLCESSSSPRDRRSTWLSRNAMPGSSASISRIRRASPGLSSISRTDWPGASGFICRAAASRR